MKRVRPLIAVSLMLVSALAVVYVRHASRVEFARLKALEAERHEIAVDYGRLQLEYATWAEGSRLERLAHEELDLREVPPAAVVVVAR